MRSVSVLIHYKNNLTSLYLSLSFLVFKLRLEVSQFWFYLLDADFKVGKWNELTITVDLAANEAIGQSSLFNDIMQSRVNFKVHHFGNKQL